jgi:hypothetical protein
LKKDEKKGFDGEEAPGDVPAFLGLWSPPKERQQDNGIGDGDHVGQSSIFVTPLFPSSAATSASLLLASFWTGISSQGLSSYP